MKGRRSTTRMATFLKAQAICPEQTPVDCLVIDISASGARLQPADPSVIDTLPERFEVLLLKTGERRTVRVAWRGESDIGVAFA